MNKPDESISSTNFKSLRSMIALLSEIERSSYQKWLVRLEKRKKQNLPFDRSFQKLNQELSTLVKGIQLRLKNVPMINFPEQLPISQHKQQLTDAIKKHQVVIIAGETGSGKTTQLPKICLAMGRGINGQIGHTQPRRLAARTVATRIAEELNTPLGQGVGFKVRFDDRSSSENYIKLMTDGILLNELHHDPLLKKYDTLIIDEAHERSLNIDFILGILKQVLLKRPDLKVIITSATIDPERFSKHFSGAPIIEVSGRTYPVETLYMPLNENLDERNGTSLEEGICQASELLHSEGRGDILVFLPGEQQIRQCADYLSRHLKANFEILPLYSRLSQSEQMKIFHRNSSNVPRIVLSTNVAETSLTVPGIHYVIDGGQARMSRYSVRSKVQRLPIEAISQASANQRQGRCGRIADGICIRLYSEEDFEGRSEFTEPEIKRTNLASVILQMAILELGQIEDFEFLDPPDSRLINDGYKLLQEIGAMTASREITSLGKQLAVLPVDPKIARILLAGAKFNSLNEILIITSAMSLGDPRERPADKRQQADEKHKRFIDKDSDFIATLNLWRYFNDSKGEMSWGKLKKMCQQEYLNFNRMREWREIYGQLKRLMLEKEHKINNHQASYDDIHQALLTGLISQVGTKTSEGDYQSTRNNRFHIFPGSGLFQRKVSKENETEKIESGIQEIKRSMKWVLAGELVETQKLYARQVAKINPSWIEPLAPDLLKHQYSDPYWSRKSARAMIKESVSLYGLTILSNRPIALASSDLTLANELFIHHAMVENDFATRAAAIVHNRKCLEQVEAMEHRVRRRDILVEQDFLQNFYSSKIPEKIHNGPAFEQWYKKLNPAVQEALKLNVDDLIREEAEDIDRQAYPEFLLVNNINLELDYHFEPGAVDDGLQILIPLVYINQFKDADFDYLVPGLLELKIIALLRGLPKALRKNFVPVPEYAKTLAETIDPSNGHLVPQLATKLKKMTSVLISDDDFDSENIPENLLPYFYLIETDSNTVVDGGRNLAQLQTEYGDKALEHIQSGTKVTLLSQFPAEGFKETTTTSYGETEVELYSGLEIIDDKVAIKKYDNCIDARIETKQSLKLLLIDDSAKLIKEMRRHLPELTKAELSYATFNEPEFDELNTQFFNNNHSSLYLDLFLVVADSKINTNESAYNTAEQFDQLEATINSSLLPDIIEHLTLIEEIFRQAERLRKSISKISSPALLTVATSIQKRLNTLLYKGFISAVGWEQLHHYPRYIKALSLRYERADLNPLAEREREVIWEKWWLKFNKSRNQLIDLFESRWLMEEFHVSLFAQQLGTKKTVSEKRLDKLFNE